MATPSPTWYDVLGVERDATPEQIKAGWRAATDKFEPGSGSGQFRMLNDAADVLLDPVKRAEYDASLTAEPEPAPPVAPAPEAGSPQAAPVSQPVASSPSTDVDPKAERRRARDERRASSTERAAEKRAARSERARPPSRTAVLLAALLALLTVAALVVVGFFAVKVRSDAAVDDARDEAPAAAEQAAKAMLSYDYRTLPADRKRAGGYLTDGFKKTYLKNFSLLEKQKDGAPGAAVQTKTVVTSSVLGSGVMDAEDDKARVLVFVNQVSKRPEGDPQIFQNRVAMTMKKVGDRWLVDNLKSY
jgi:Mce-associated membrane protein